MARELQDILDSGELTGMTVPKVKFSPQINVPLTEEGLLFYHSLSKTHVSNSNIPEVSLNIGQEQFAHVINRSGIDIPNGSPVYYFGTDLSTKLPSVALARADAYTTARVIGVATHNIGIGQEGIVTTFGKINEIDTTQWIEGQILYLSADVAGGYVTEPPDIVTSLGITLIVDPVQGTLFININNLIALPTVIGYMNGGQLPATIDGTPSKIINFTTSGNVVTPVDPINGEISILTDGIYRLSATISFTHDDTGPASDVITLGLHNGISEVLSFDYPILRNQDATTIIVATPFHAVSGEIYSLWIYSTETLTAVTPGIVSFDIKSESIR